MTQLETGPQALDNGPPPTRLRRSREDRVIAGICGGLGRYFNMDPLWFRLGFVLVTLAGGAGILIYLVCWLIIPEAGPDEAVGTRDAVSGAQGPMVIGVVLVGIGMMLLIDNLFPWFDKVMWPVAIIAGGAGLFYLGSRHEHN
ncbi:MAG TPA: PspC domain-containing protein [Acidimicrobiia bacterium]|nr:PspC domain-containing protein [Acidimicrobiia bacterium]